MPRPTANTALQRPDLGAIAYEYLMAADQAGYIAGLVMPIFESEFISADYPIIPIEAFMKHFDTSRAPGGLITGGITNSKPALSNASPMAGKSRSMMTKPACMPATSTPKSWRCSGPPRSS